MTSSTLHQQAPDETPHAAAAAADDDDDDAMPADDTPTVV